MRFIGNAPVDGEVRAIASGALATGDTVVVNSDGTVSVVAETSISEGAGSNVAFESATTTFIGSAYDATAQKVVIAYRDNGNSSYGTAVVGAVSGTSISFGSPVAFNSIETNNISVAYDVSAGKTVVCCNEVGPTSEDGVVYVGTVSGTSISFGSRQVFKSASVYPVEPSIAYDSTNSKIVIAYEHENNTLSGIVGTVSGSSVTFGSPTTIASATVAQVRTLHDSVNNRIVVLYSDQSNSDYGKAAVGTVSDTSISFGSVVTFESASTQDIAAAYDSANGKVVAVFRDGNNSAYGTGIVGTVSGTSISFGTPVVFESASVDWLSAAYNTAAGKVIIVYQDKGNSDTGTYVEGTVSDTSISFDTPTIFPSEADAIYTSVTYDSDQYAAVVSFMNIDNASYGTAFSYQSAASLTNLTSENFVGFANSGYADGQSAALNSTCSVDKNQSGLTAGQTYYVQTDGTLGTTPASPSVLAGTAISSNSIIVKG